MRRYRAWCTCSWHGIYDTEPRAQHALRVHHCERREAQRTTARRGRARRAQIDRTPVECTHPLANHQHGTYATYTLDGCRCPPCTAAASTYNQDRERRIAYGQPGRFVDATPTRTHVRRLMDAGIGYKTIARRADLASSTLNNLLRGKPGRPPSAKVARTTADALLAVQANLDTMADGALTDATGTARRARALIARGWSIPKIAHHAGVDRQAIDPILTGAWTTVTARTAKALAASYDALWDQEPPEGSASEKGAATRARRRAVGMGWAPPLAWDDDTIEDPGAQPAPGWRGPSQGECASMGCPDVLLRGDLCATHRQGLGGGGRRLNVDLDEWLHLARLGEDLDRAARRVGAALATVESVACAAGRADILRLTELRRRQAKEARTHVVPTNQLGARGARAAG